MAKQAGPPSPTPSGDGYGFRRTTRYSAARAMYANQTLQQSQAAQLGDFHSQYPHHEMETDVSADPLSQDMRAAAYGNYAQGQQQMKPSLYSTPETSPALTSQLENVRATRSRVRQPRLSETKKPAPVKSGCVEKPNPKKRKRSGGAAAAAGAIADAIKKPLTEYASDYPHIKTLDIESFVRRSTEARHREVLESKDGKVKRPMNAFLLYRKTYQDLAKQLSEDTNHQQISRTCGQGWGIEPPHVRDRFTVLADIERNNHKIAHPDYKFTPRSAKKAKKVEVESEDELPDQDPDWTPPRGASNGRQARNHPQDDAPLSVYSTYQPQNTSVGYGPGAIHPSQSMYPQPRHGKAIPMVYDNGTFAGYYHHPGVYQGSEGVIEDGRSPPPVTCSQNDQYAGEYPLMPTQYPSSLVPQVGAQYLIDPSLVSETQDPYGAGPYEGYGTQAENEPGWATQAQVMQDSLAPVDDMLVNDPQLGYLKGGDGSWQVEELPPFDGTGWAAA